MRHLIKFLLGLLALMIATMVGLYFAGWLSILFMGQQDQIVLHMNTYRLYLDVLDRSDIAPYAIRIEAAGVICLGLAFLIWLGFMWWLLVHTPEFIQSMTFWEQVPGAGGDQSMQRPPPLDSSGQMTAPAPNYDNGREDWTLPQTQQQPQRRQKQGDRNFKKTGAALAAVAAATALVGCDPPKAHVHHNPHPRQRYEITMVINGAPGPFETIDGTMSYYVTNPEDCVPQSLPSGAYIRPEDDVSIAWTRVGDNTYKGYIYLDLPLDEDYYGLGVCHWAASGMGVDLIFKETNFGSILLFNQIISQQSSITFFNKEAYGQTKFKNFIDGGTGYTDWIAQHPNNFFSITLTAKEAFK